MRVMEDHHGQRGGPLGMLDVNILKMLEMMNLIMLQQVAEQKEALVI